MSSEPTPSCCCRKKRILRRLGKIAAWTAGVLVVLFFVFQYALGGIVKRSATAVGPVVLGTDISISNCYTRIFSGQVNVEGLVIGPPEGFDANLFEIEQFKIDLDTSTLLCKDKPIHIREIRIDSPIVSYELKGIHDNLHALLRKLGVDDSEDAPKDDPSANARKIVIDHFIFEGGRVRIAVADGKGAVIPLPTIELRDIGAKNGGATGLEATGQIIKSIVTGTLKAVAGLVGDVGGLAVDAVKGVGGAAVDGVKNAGGAIVKGIGGLFGGDEKEEAPADPAPEATEK